MLRAPLASSNRPLALGGPWEEENIKGLKIAGGAPEDAFHSQHLLIWESFPG